MGTPALRAFAFSLVLSACSSSSEETSAPPPPPLPTAPAVPTPEAPVVEAPAPSEPVGEAPAEKPRANAPADDDDEANKPAAEKPASKPGASLYDLAKEGKATLPTPKPSTPAPKPVQPTKPNPGTITKPTIPTPGTITKPEPKPSAPKGKVNIPSTANVKVTVPAGLQAALDADPRMQSWVNQVVSIADACYKSERAKNPAAEGTIQLRVTLHENERPDGDVQSVPTPLAGVFTCGSTKLMRVKMPFFSGPEGQKHTVKLTFTK